MSEERSHIPVLLTETIEALNLKPGLSAVDGTLGAGGHAEAILERTSPDGRLLGLDLDEAALETAQRNLRRFGSRAMLVRASYRYVDKVLLSTSFGSFQAALLDLGFSSIEIDDPSRGFSFRHDGPLDMRYDRTQDTTAASIVNGSSPDELTDLLRRFGEEREAHRIALAIVAARRRGRILSTLELAEVVSAAVSPMRRRGRTHPATKTFQALRIAVNDELATVEEGIGKLFDRLDVGGRLAVISFHSLEDRVVKRFMKAKVKEGAAKAVTGKPVTAGDEETKSNPRARSAKLRAIEKTE